jgi:hypothetical protein
VIQVTSGDNDPQFTFNAFVRGLPIYLDNWAIINLAKSAPSLRGRFVDAILTGGDLLFSMANVVELIGPQGRSSDLVKSFLDELGPHWFPVELNPMTVVQREQQGLPPAQSCLSRGLMNAFVENRAATGYAAAPFREDFFRLGTVLDWVAQSQPLRIKSGRLDEAMRNAIPRFRTDYKQNPLPLDQRCAPAFDPSRPATFTSWNLLRTLIVESHPMKAHDGLDFCHAVMASSFAEIATLDTQWKRRVESLRKPNQLARIYGPLELDQMVKDMETCLV